MIEHRVAAEGTAELMPQAQEDRSRLRPLEQHLALAVIGFDPIECHQEIGLPGGTAELAVGGRAEARRLLLGDHRFDLAILDLFERGIIDFSALMLGTRLLQAGRTQQAAHVVGAKRWL